MPLYFTDKKRHWPPPKPVQYLLATLALIVAGTILVGWLLLRFVYTDDEQTPTKSTTGTTTTTQVQSVFPDNAYCLFIIEDAGYEGFALIEFAPNDNRITVDAIPANLQLSENETIAQMYQRTKATQTTQAIAEHYQLPLEHYISLSIAEMEKLVMNWGGSLRMAPPEEISYKDENGATVHLPAEVNAMSPKQVTAILRNTNWRNEESGIVLAADLAAALLNQNLTDKRDLSRCFSDISSHTNLKIHGFTNYQKALNHLASLNDGAIAQRGAVLTTK